MPDGAFVERFRYDLDRLLDEARVPDAASIGVALSGGPDSCALLLLAAVACPGRVHAITVDHGLRPAAAQEAADAAALCGRLGVPHEVAKVVVDPRGSVQAAAREKRYGAVSNWAARQGIPAVLTGHHADDQAETLLMRFARGAGLGGLSGIRPVRPIGKCVLLRPLLGWRKAELEAIVANAGVVPARDPSNDDPRYDRTAARALLAGADWLDPLRVARSADHLRDAEAALHWMVEQLAPNAIVAEADEVSMPASLPSEILRRLMLCILAERFAKSADGPAVERAMAALARGETVTLADILVRPEAGRWHFRAAPPRRST